MSKLQVFPHFIRIFSAGALWGLLAFIFSLNIYSKATLSPSYWPGVITALQNPYSRDAHIALAQNLWQLGFLVAAKRELTIAQQLGGENVSKSPESREQGVLGTFTTPQDLLAEWEEEPTRVARDYEYWQGVVRSKPDYRDGLITLASLAYQLSKPEEAKTYLSQAMTLDPNNEAIGKLLSLFP